jgi:hypothetical protein
VTNALAYSALASVAKENRFIELSPERRIKFSTTLFYCHIPFFIAKKAASKKLFTSPIFT